MKGTKVFSYLEVKQRMGDKIGMGSDTVRGRRCLDGECLLGKMFSVRGFIIAFFAKRRHSVPLLCSRVSSLAFFRRSEYGTKVSLKIILRALF